MEKGYTRKQFIEKLSRLTDCLENGESLRIQIGGECLTVSPNAVLTIEHEREDDQQEVEFQMRWSV